MYSPRVVRVPVVVRWPNVHERRVVAQGQHAEAKPVEDVCHAGNARELAERDHPVT